MPSTPYLQVPLSLEEELVDLTRRAEAAAERMITTANEAKRAAEDVAALKRTLGAPKAPSRGAKPELSAGQSSGSFF